MGVRVLSEMDNAWLVTVWKIEDQKSRSLKERNRKERFGINNASRENALRTTYHYRVFGIQIPGSKNAL